MSFVLWIAIMKNPQNRHPGKEAQSHKPQQQQQQQQMDPQRPQKGGKQQETPQQQGSMKHPQQR
ncbi:lana protein [Stenotrophomonas maltophilia]|uniref:lana protein n=1 Tax=Stenotrophomonas maltophilia TaxID=40324 RepID=UPI002ACCF30D|nr:lana protein [Stenotrophomonas maltophilia]MDZ5843080.1 lana protein [Stenotrophomonas maltophilia]